MIQQKSSQQQKIESIEKIVIDKENFIKHWMKNIRLQDTLYTQREVYVSSPDDDGVSSTNIEVNPTSDGGYWSSSPHPIYLSLANFVDVDGLEDVGFPTEGKNRRITEEAVNYDPDENPDKFEEDVEESLWVWKDMYRDELEYALKQEIDINGHTIDVNWDE